MNLTTTTARLARTTLPPSALAAALLTWVGVTEAWWRTRHGFSSPWLALVYVLPVFLLGRSIRRASLRRSVRPIVDLVVGVAASMLLYVALALGGQQRLFAPVVGAVALAAAYRSRHYLAATRVRVTTLLQFALVVVFAARATHLVDRLSLTERTPSGFAWIDTPFWLDVAYGIERGCPVPDLLYAGRTANYHFGASTLIAAIRGVTGLPMHVAYFCAMVLSVTCAAFACVEVAVCVAPRRKLRSLLRTVVPWCGIVWVECFAFNFPSVVALPLLLVGIALALRAPAPRAVVLWVLLFGALVLTKEVAYLFLALTGGAVLLVSGPPPRRFARLGTFCVAVLATRPLYERLVRTDQRAHLRPFSEHLDVDWIVAELAKESHVFLLCGLVGAWLWANRGQHGRLWALPLTAFCVHAVGFSLSAFVKPTFDPPMDPFSYSWILVDMGQFQTHSRQLAVAALVLTTLSLLGRAVLRPPPAFALGTAAALVLYAVLNTWRSQVFAVTPEHPEHDLHDPVVELLAQVEPRRAVIASNRFDWNDENPFWSAYYGHAFYFLRRGRWANAYPDFEHRKSVQETLFRTDDPKLVQQLARTEGITHVLTDKQAPPPWTRGARCSVENARYCIVTVAPAPP